MGMLKLWISKFGIAVTNLIGIRTGDAPASLTGLNGAKEKSTLKTTDQVIDRMLNLNGLS